MILRRAGTRCPVSFRCSELCITSDLLAILVLREGLPKLSRVGSNVESLCLSHHTQQRVALLLEKAAKAGSVDPLWERDAPPYIDLALRNQGTDFL